MLLDEQKIDRLSHTLHILYCSQFGHSSLEAVVSTMQQFFTILMALFMSISRFAATFLGDDWIFFKKLMSNPQISKEWNVVDVCGWIMRWRRQMTLLISSKFLRLRSIQVRMNSGDPLWSRSETSRESLIKTQIENFGWISPIMARTIKIWLSM